MSAPEEEQFMFAAAAGNVEALKTLFDDGVDVDCSNADLGNAVYQAILAKKLEALKYLIDEAGANVNAPVFNNQFTPLIACVVKNFEQGFDFLLAKPNVRVNHQSKTGNTALMMAVRYRRTEMAVKLIAHPGLDPSPVNTRQRNALMMAVAAENERVVKLLIAHPKSRPWEATGLLESPLKISREISNQEIKIAVEDASLPELKTQIGTSLKDTNLRGHCKRLYDLKIREISDLDREKVDDKYLSWKGNVDNAAERRQMLEIFADLKEGNVAVATPVAAKEVNQIGVPFANLI